MKDSTKAIIAGIGGIALYLFVTDRAFRKAIIEVILERIENNKMTLKECPSKGSERCVCNIPPDQLEKLGLYCPYDPKDSYKEELTK